MAWLPGGSSLAWLAAGLRRCLWTVQVALGVFGGGADDLQRVWDVEGAEGLLRSGSGWGGDAGLAGDGFV